MKWNDNKYSNFGFRLFKIYGREISTIDVGISRNIKWYQYIKIRVDTWSIINIFMFLFHDDVFSCYVLL